MDLVVEQVGQVSLISVVGSVDALTAPELASGLEAQLESGRAQLAEEWPAWLEKHHATKQEAWVLHSKKSARSSVAYEEAVAEALWSALMGEGSRIFHTSTAAPPPHPSTLHPSARSPASHKNGGCAVTRQACRVTIF
jgi:hypothetical protein